MQNNILTIVKVLCGVSMFRLVTNKIAPQYKVWHLLLYTRWKSWTNSVPLSRRHITHVLCCIISCNRFSHCMPNCMVSFHYTNPSMSRSHACHVEGGRLSVRSHLAPRTAACLGCQAACHQYPTSLECLHL